MIIRSIVIMDDVDGALKIMKEAICAGRPDSDTIARCAQHDSHHTEGSDVRRLACIVARLATLPHSIQVQSRPWVTEFTHEVPGPCTSLEHV
jgi:hypothetical protein